MPAEKKSISFDPETLSALDRRGGDNLSGQVQLVVYAYAEACRIGFQTVRRTLTRSEVKLILDTMNATVMIMIGSPLEHWITSPSGIAHNVSDAIDLDVLDQKWEVNGQELLKKLDQFDRLANLALLDWCQVMWENCHEPGYWDAELEKFRE